MNPSAESKPEERECRRRTEVIHLPKHHRDGLQLFRSHPVQGCRTVEYPLAHRKSEEATRKGQPQKKKLPK